MLLQAHSHSHCWSQVLKSTSDLPALPVFVVFDMNFLILFLGDQLQSDVHSTLDYYGAMLPSNHLTKNASLCCPQ